ncbi:MULTISPECIES: SpoIIIAH-like family protein [Clostridium]|uniref:SpoIIIAH-like protein n=2 Tax=Clostridium TaxID=1485 RepID=A0A151AQC5_9CLOT|nr:MULTISPECIES: SpoIIIAH-like family protein [Clostridium]MBE6078973.1 SpoIIIAH-like family protein [Clostridium lundense]KYH29815.1 SpoIIIAH-like protein [Clostridium colicanis DSM 13634]MBE6042726.1 SpoIIIAH-like family protein [Clostridium thermopalmarium]PRR75196.1 SpoIIIAH-like protein [Clostridium thermopalmarium DSM 5974]PVZ27952.1 stage III sporulation protein AH [Clostridium thermopalmarium DSM 5974]
MNKKQGVIIVVLLALIVCAGVLATKLNADLDYVAGNDITNGKDAISFNDASKNTSGSNYFEEAQIIRDNNAAQALQNLKALIDDEHTSKEDRAELSKKYTNLALATTNQSQIETILKSKGYEDVLCYVQDNKVTVIIKSSKKLSESQQKQIQDVVMDVTQIRDVEIQLKE